MSQQSETIELDVTGLYNNWQPSQKNLNINPAKVAAVVAAINANAVIDPIIIENLVDVAGTTCIRTADGRHRITAFQQLGLLTIRAVKSEISVQVKEVFAL